jgi:ubiquinone/menaquinone biosynthesis C-methylase UbiE
VDARVDYDRRQYAVYSAGRAPMPAMVEQWIGALAPHIERGARVLDLGSGIGTWSELLAERFGAEVSGVEPSDRMREVAERDHARPGVRYLAGSAENIPLPEASCDTALLSYVLHHVEDRGACAAELLRVLRPRGRVVVRGTLRESLPGVPWFAFWPTARPVAEQRMLPEAEVVDVFGSQGFELLVSEVIDQPTAPSLAGLHERLRHRAVSTLELIDDAEFEEGLERLRLAAARDTDPRPVMEPVNLLVFRRPR